MFPPLLIALLVVPLVEIYVLIQVKDVIGAGWTIVALLGMSILGAWLLKREGLATWRRLRETLQRGAMPTAELTDGAMILVGGAFILTPGFITDIFGLLLILPPTRLSLKGIFRRFLGGWFLARAGMADRVGRGIYAGKVVRSRRTGAATGPPSPATPRPAPTPSPDLTEAPRSPSSERPDDADDSRGTG